MQGSNLNIEDNNSTPTIIQTDVASKNGQNKCSCCGSTDISINPNTGKLRCNFCRKEFESEKISGMVEDISQLTTQIIGSGATDIIADTNDVLTFKCSSCGAEVVIDTASSTQARCHWCRNTLSVNQQIPNGTIPDVVLPFQVPKDVAKSKIEEFVGKRKFFAHPRFKREFTTDNIMGVYLPYMVVDINSHAKLIGEGEHLVKTYIKGDGQNATTYYDADLYNVEREYDVAIYGLTVESSVDKLNKYASDKTNNIINSIMPFDIENCTKYDSNYIKGYTSEKRNINIENLKTLVDEQTKEVAKFAANETLQEYDRGVAWSSEEYKVIGQQWKAAYLPVWLYSYQEVKGDKKVLHYVAVNARTKKTMGSVPIHMPKLIEISVLVEVLGILIMVFIDFSYEILLLFSGIVYFLIYYFKYRNVTARHTYETDTNTKIQNLRKVDNYVTRRTELTNPKIKGNNNTTNSNDITDNIINNITSNSTIANFIKENINNKESR